MTRDVGTIATAWYALAIQDFLNGSVIYAFLLLIISAFDPDVLRQLSDAKISVALAGGVGLFFIVGELAKSCSPRP